MMDDRTFDNFVKVLKRAYEKRGEAQGGDFFEQKVLASVRSVAAHEEASERLYLRFAIAALSLALVVHLSSQYSFIEDKIATYTISSQVDPVDMSEDLDD